MSDQIALWVLIPLLFVPVFLALWLLVTTLLSHLSGWTRLQSRYPDREDAVLGTLRFRSAQMGRFMVLGFGYGHCLHFEVCATGLRARVWKLLGPFCRPFFVPWQEIHVERRRFLFFKWLNMAFGTPRHGQMAISTHTGGELAHLSGGRFRIPNAAP